MKSGGERARVRVGVDTGGTFTDFVYHAGGRARVFKVPSTPDDPSRAIAEGLRRAAREALVTNKGFEDVLVIGRQARGSLYDLDWTRPAPLVADGLRFGVRGRVAADGSVVEELEAEEVASLVRKLKRAR